MTHVLICISKRPFGSPSAALEAARDAADKSGKAIRVYPCPVCWRWHLTSKVKKSGKRNSQLTAWPT